MIERHIHETSLEHHFIYNLWYCAAWSSEITDNLVYRKILNKPILLFRDKDGSAKAIINLCSHKLAPLHLGKLVNGTVECGYHGLRFNGQGKCVYNPQPPHRIPANADIPSFPLVERNGIIWIWMGNPERADDALIVDFSYIDAPDRKTIRSLIHLKGNYLLLVENLMDLGHAYYLHQASTGGITNPHFEIDVGQDENVVYDRRVARGLPGPSFLTQWLTGIHDGVCDTWQDIQWAPAGIFQNRVGATYPGTAPPGSIRPTEDAVGQIGSHILTPETPTTTHYFCANSRNYALDDPDVDQFWRDWQKNALEQEDSGMIEQIELMREDSIALGMKPKPFLHSDSSGVRVRRHLQKIVSEEL